MRKQVFIGLGGALVVAAMVATALFLSSLLTPDPSSCGDMASASSTEAARDAERVHLVIGLAGNGPSVAAEAREFVRTALEVDAPDARTVVTVTLVNGATNYRPFDDGHDDCIGRPLLVSASEADLKSYENASDDARSDVESALREQYRGQVDLVAEAVASSVRSAPAPESEETGAFVLWPFVADVPAGQRVSVLGPFTVGGDNCLTVEAPASLVPDGSTTVVAERVRQCAGAGELSDANADEVHLVPVGSLTMTGSQRDAQGAVIDALCQHATADGCRSDG